MFRSKYKKLLLFCVIFTAISVLAGSGVVSGNNEASARDNSIPAEHIKIDQFQAPSSGRFLSAATAPTEHLSVPAGEQSFTFKTQTYTPELDMNALGVKLTGSDLVVDANGNGSIEIVAHINGRKQDVSRQLPPLNDDLKEPLAAGVFVTKPVIVEDVVDFSLELTLNRLTDGTSPTIDDVEIIYLDSSRGTPRSAATVSTSAGKKTDEPNIITRKEWGADEKYRRDADGDVIWPIKYKDPEVFIIHHTAGTDGGDDPAATVRAVYYWHAMVLGWGDIGYNYLIDPAGNIYKGRKGKDGAIGGHTFNDSDNINYNDGSIGIALLGCYEETQGACYTQYEMTPEMKAALAKLIGYKAAEEKIKPKSKTTLKGATAKRVSGHRDLDYTYCPGSDLYELLKTIRKKSQEQYEIFSLKPWEAQFDDVAVTLPESEEALDTATLEAGIPYQVTMQYTNTGKNTWRQNKLKLKVYNGTGKAPTSLAHNSWSDGYGKIQMNEESVAPGQTASFTFLIKSPTEAKVRNIVTKLFHGKTKVKSSNATSTFTFLQKYAGELTAHTFPVAMFAGSEQTASFTFTNVGEMPWKKKAAVTINGEKVGKLGSVVLTGQSATVDVTFTAPSPKKSGKVKTFVVQLEQNGMRIAGTRTVFVARID
ncbi:peptidoglycan recognition family protein [Patescibacteria group bacterium]